MNAISFQKILVATDYTELAENALNTAAAICQKHNATLLLLHVLKYAPVDRSPEDYHLVLDYTTEMKIAAKTELKRLGDQIRESYRIPVEEIVTYGDVVKEIVRVIQESKPDLVLIGTHGESGFRRMFIGTTAYRVIKHTTFPVMTIPGTGDWSTFKNVLFPVRTIPYALDKYDRVRPIICKDRPTIHVLGLSMEGPADRMSEVFDLEGKLERRLQQDQVAFDVSFYHCTNYADTILKAVEEKKADLIVINATLDTTRKEFFIGPFSQQILNHAKVPVLCIRYQ